MTVAGIVGFGLAGRSFHVPLLQAAGIRIGAVVTRQRDAVISVLPEARVLNSDAELFGNPEIDLVVIATPNHLHFDQAAAALKAGKHVVVDKPLCLHADAATRLGELAKTQRRVLAVFQNRRWDADFLTIRKLIDDGRLGALNAFHARWDRYRPQVADRWREQAQEGNGVLYDLGAHLIDQALCLFGMPDWIQADVFTQRDAVASDGFELLLVKDKARITLGVSTLSADGGPRYRVQGANGSYVKHGIDVQETQLRAGLAANDPAFGIEPETQWGTFMNGATGEREPVTSLQGRWTHFYAQVRRAIEHGEPPPVSASEASDVIRIVEAAMQSSVTGKRVMF